MRFSLLSFGGKKSWNVLTWKIQAEKQQLGLQQVPWFFPCCPSGFTVTQRNQALPQRSSDVWKWPPFPCNFARMGGAAPCSKSTAGCQGLSAVWLLICRAVCRIGPWALLEWIVKQCTNQIKMLTKIASWHNIMLTVFEAKSSDTLVLQCLMHHIVVKWQLSPGGQRLTPMCPANTLQSTDKLKTRSWRSSDQHLNLIS